jgi:hypothetical protein
MIERNYAGTFRPDLLIEDITTAMPELIGQPLYVGLIDGGVVVGCPDDTDTARLDQAVAGYDPNGETQADKFRDAIIATAQGAVGVALKDLTSAQIKSLMAILLYKARGVDPVTLAVKPLSAWV